MANNSPQNEPEDISRFVYEVPLDLADERARGFLSAGDHLFLQELGLTGIEEGNSLLKKSLTGISRRRVVYEAQITSGDQTLTEAEFRRRWKEMDQYRSDLIRFMLRSPLAQVQHPDRLLALLTPTEKTPIVQLIQEIAYLEVDSRRQDHSFRLQMAFRALFCHHQDAASVLRQVERQQVDGWRDIYRDILEAQNLRLRPGVTVEDLTLALHLAGKAVAFHAVLGEGESRRGYAKAIDPERGTTFLSEMIFALILGLIDPGDGRTLRDAARTILEDTAPPKDDDGDG